MKTKRTRARLAFWAESFRAAAHKRTFYLSLLGCLLIIIFGGSLIILLFEKHYNPTIQTYGNALWLSIVTMTTVGFGDVVPVTAGGRFTCMICMVLSIGLLTTFITARAAVSVERAKRRAKGLQHRVKSQDHYVVCGWNPRGHYVLSRLKEELERERTQIVLLCNLEEKPVDDDYVFFVRGNQASASALESANIGEARAAILLADEAQGGSSDDIDARTVLAALAIRSINPDIQMTAEVLEPENVHHLELAGVGEILDSNLLIGNLLARSAMHYGLISATSELVTKERGVKLYRIPATEEMADMSGDQLVKSLERDFGSTLVAVRSEDGIQAYSEDIRISPGDLLVVLAEVKPPGAL